MTATELVATVRRRSGLGVRELARRAGTSHATVLAYERGAKEPRLDTLERLAAAAGFRLHVSLEPRADAGPAIDRKAAELVDALLLAEQFPSRRRRRLDGPVFGRPV
jgi:transcriptional regulator with XRE-family HTH domain